MRTFEVSIRVKNNLLKQRREECGMSCGEMAQAIGVSYGAYIDYEALRISPLNASGDWKPTATKIAEYYDVPCEELWPDAVLTVERSEVSRKVDARDLFALGAYAMSVTESPYDKLERAELQDEVETALSTLPPRWRQVLEMLYGFKGDEQGRSAVGQELGICAQRVGQIEEQALTRLRTRRRSLGIGR